MTIKKVPAGEYLVVAQIPQYGFHEVYRIIPGENQTAGPFRHNRWEQLSDGTIDLVSITILRSEEVSKGMTRFPWLPPWSIPTFYLDPIEVTMGAYRKSVDRIPQIMERNVVPDNHPVCYVTYDQALNYAEKIGKRLPDEAEYEFAATKGGKWRFPWGPKGPQEIVDWPLGPVRHPAFDQTDTEPPVFGLFSNVAEWTTSWFAPYPGDSRTECLFPLPRKAVNIPREPNRSRRPLVCGF
jgi:hypothetical protein